MKLTEQANDSYYNDDEELLTDDEFNLLSDNGLETRNFRVKTDHHQPMGSLKKIKTEEEFYKWAKGDYFVVTPKLDGNSIEMVFDNGKLIKAITRGNGCLDENSIVEFENGQLDSISNVIKNKNGGKIKSYNHLTEKIEYKEITNWFINQNDKSWFEIELENGKKLKLTENHQVWSVDRQMYIKAKYLRKDENLLFSK